MRTTVTIDADTEHLLRQEVRRTGRSYKEILNLAIRRSLLPRAEENKSVKVTPLFKAPFPPALSRGSMNRLADQWDDEDTLRELTR